MNQQINDPHLVVCRFLLCVLPWFAFPLTGEAQQRNAGIFYSSIFAKTAPYKRISGWGANARNYFLKDVNGDGKDDAVVYYVGGKWQAAISDGVYFTNPRDMLIYKAAVTLTDQLLPLMGDVNGDKKADAVFFDPGTGNWLVAVSNGWVFAAPVQWSAGNGAGSAKQFLADVNGDGKDDAVFFLNRDREGCWYVGLSDGKGGFGRFTRWICRFGYTADEQLMADVNGDGAADAVVMEKINGTWRVALSDRTKLADAGLWRSGFGQGCENVLAYDVDKDDKADIAYYKEGDWWVCYSTGSAFDPDESQRWVVGNRPATMVSRSNRPAPEGRLIGSVSGTVAGACAISAGDWLVLDNGQKRKPVEAYAVDTWDAGGNPYTPQFPGHAATYDAADPVINDLQLRMIHDAGFTYLMLDITNGANSWVDDRARRMIERIIYWNHHLKGNQHKMYFCISMGGSRRMVGKQAADQVELESKRTWDEFYIPYKEAYYVLKGKPLLVHFVEFPTNKDDILQYAGQMPFFQQFTERWMFNEIKDQPDNVNAYGWPILEKQGNPVGDEVMNVSPGFWNGNLSANRENGELYRRHWLRVLQHNPASVWVNSYNETWEHTGVAPAYLNPEVAAASSGILSVWTDYYGDRMDDFYWVMTQQYNRLFMYRELFINSYLQEDQSNDIYQVKRNRIERTGTILPRRAPVLLVPKNFIRNFSGNVISDSLKVIGKVRGARPVEAVRSRKAAR
ncbi:hypothetical protein [Niabella drilacis]|uniref:Repeat domain-containing protein n=1 Tax=Niabella drilacis (strain DSM 25811 / CCM 8410 / CCUG 62505 / LMG 26954 / E90) TaxID=1285928 RepID=A0A1G6JID1_NIADE|nr:hypothetical protein [Niabella drilacis]SDC18473.1 Repeat domain-containing protein [Niabella drilacis]